MSERHELCFAVLRFDGSETLTVKEIVWTVERATSEVTRLNKVNAEKGCHYAWVATRAEKR
jgi:hypothetical protein